jgi:hypothetical protein
MDLHDLKAMTHEKAMSRIFLLMRIRRQLRGKSVAGSVRKAWKLAASGGDDPAPDAAIVYLP